MHMYPQGIQPEVIAHKNSTYLLRQKNPKVHYRVGAPLQKLSVVLKGILPSRLFEKLLLNSILKLKSLTMKFFIDTANLDQIREAEALGVLDGVTTNPSLMAKEGITGEKNIIQHYVDICELVEGDVSAEVIAVDFEGMVKEGEALGSLTPSDSRKNSYDRRGNQSLKILF